MGEVRMLGSLSHRWKMLLLILLIFEDALAFRLFWINHESVWFDESVAVYEIAPGLGLGAYIENVTKVDPTAANPGYFALLWSWCQVFGMSEFAMRMLSVLLGSLSVVMVYLISREVFRGAPERFTCTWLAMVSITNVYYSQEIRTYPLYLLMATVSIWSFIRLVKGRDRWAVWINLFGNAVLLWSHMLSLTLIAFEAAVYAWHCRRQLARLMWWGLPQAVHFLFWCVVCLRGMEFDKIDRAAAWRLGLEWGFDAFWDGWRKSISSTMARQYLFSDVIGVVCAVLFVIAAILIMSRFRRGRVVQSMWMLLALVGLAPLLMFLFSKFVFAVWVARYTVYAHVGIIFMTVLGVNRLAHLRASWTARTRHAVTISACALLCVIFTAQYVVAERPFRPDWNTVHKTIDDGRPLLVFPIYERQTLKKTGVPVIGLASVTLKRQITNMEDRLRATGGWLIYISGEAWEPPEVILKEILVHRLRVPYRKTVGNISIWEILPKVDRFMRDPGSRPTNKKPPLRKEAAS